jgi:hypothetical protein
METESDHSSDDSTESSAGERNEDNFLNLDLNSVAFGDGEEHFITGNGFRIPGILQLHLSADINEHQAGTLYRELYSVYNVPFIVDCGVDMFNVSADPNIEDVEFKSKNVIIFFSNMMPPYTQRAIGMFIVETINLLDIGC